jgi:hypothetical protein
MPRSNLATCCRCGKVVFRRVSFMKYSFKIFALTALVVFALFLTACPSAQTIQKAKATSAKLASYANAGVNITRDLHREKIISLSLKDDIADAFVVLADAGIAFDAAIKKAETAYGSSVPKSEIAKLFAVFDAEVVAKFLVVLEKLKLVTNATAYLAIIESLKAAILIVAEAFDRKAEVEAKLA